MGTKLGPILPGRKRKTLRTWEVRKVEASFLTSQKSFFQWKIPNTTFDQTPDASSSAAIDGTIRNWWHYTKFSRKMSEACGHVTGGLRISESILNLNYRVNKSKMLPNFTLYPTPWSINQHQIWYDSSL